MWQATLVAASLHLMLRLVHGQFTYELRFNAETIDSGHELELQEIHHHLFSNKYLIKIEFKPGLLNGLLYQKQIISYFQTAVCLKPLFNF